MHGVLIHPARHTYKTRARPGGSRPYKTDRFLHRLRLSIGEPRCVNSPRKGRVAPSPIASQPWCYRAIAAATRSAPLAKRPHSPDAKDTSPSRIASRLSELGSPGIQTAAVPPAGASPSGLFPCRKRQMLDSPSYNHLVRSAKNPASIARPNPRMAGCQVISSQASLMSRMSEIFVQLQRIGPYAFATDGKTRWQTPSTERKPPWPTSTRR